MISLLYKQKLDIIGLWHTHITSAPFSLIDCDTNFSFAKLNDFGTLSMLIDKETRKCLLYYVTPNDEYTEVTWTVSNNDFFSYIKSDYLYQKTKN